MKALRVKGTRTADAAPQQQVRRDNEELRRCWSADAAAVVPVTGVLNAAALAAVLTEALANTFRLEKAFFFL